MRLIDKDELTRRLNTGMNIIEMMQTVMDMPTIEERKTGKWARPNRPKTYERFCSECQEKAWYCGTGDYNFCPNCGADMRGEGT